MKIKKVFSVLTIYLFLSAVLLCCSCSCDMQLQNKCKVEFNLNGGVAETIQQEYSYGEEYSLFTPEKENFIFGGWYYNDMLIGMNGTWGIEKDRIVLTAKWHYTVTFVQEGYDDIVITLKEGEKLQTEDIPVLRQVEGYDTVWSITDFSEVFYSVVVNLITTPKEYKIYYTNIDGVTNTDVLSCDTEGFYQSVTYGTAYSLFVPEKEGSVFVCWFEGQSARTIEGEFWEYPRDVVLTCEWASSLKVTFIQEGWRPVTIEVTEGQSLNTDEIPQVHTETGYRISWREQDLEKLKDIRKPITVYAVKTPITYHIIFNSDTGEYVQDIYVKYGYDYCLPKPVHQKGYYFDGWYSGINKILSSGTKWYLTTGDENNDITLKAKWKCIVTIKYSALDRQDEIKYVGFGEDLKDIPSLYQKAGYFVYYEDGFMDKIKGVISNVTVNIYEEIKIFTVYYDLSDGENINTYGLNYDSERGMHYQTVCYGDAYSLKQPPKSKDDEHFSFWEFNGKYITTAGTWKYDFDSLDVVVKVCYGEVETPGY